MKHKNYLSAIAFAAMTAAALTSCRDNLGGTDNSPELDENVVNKTLLVATIEDTPQQEGEEEGSRTIYTDDGQSYSTANAKVKVYWAEKDTIRLYKANGETGVGADTVTFMLKDGKGTKKGGFVLKWAAAQDPDDGVQPQNKRYNQDLTYKVIYPAPKDDVNRLLEARDLTAETFLNSPSNTPQMQDGGNNNMEHLARYDMLTATKAAGKSEIKMQHEVAVLRILVHFNMTAGGSTTIDAFQGAKLRMLTISGPASLKNKHYQIAIPDAKAPVMEVGKSTAAFYLTMPEFWVNGGEKMNIQCTLVRELATPVKDAAGHVIQTGEVLTMKQEHQFVNGMTFYKGCIYEIKQNVNNVMSRIPVVDMGNGQIWATRNIGACDSYDDGLYFQWGETNGWQYNGPLMIHKGWDTTKDLETYYMTDKTNISTSTCRLLNNNYASLINLGFRKIVAHRLDAASTWAPGDKTFTDVPDYQGVLININNETRSYNIVNRTYNAKSNGSYGTANGGHSYFPLYNQQINSSRQYGYVLRSGKTNNHYGWHKTYTDTKYDMNQTTVGNGQEPYMVGDAAMYQWGDAWHMPTTNQLAKLLSETKGNMVNAYNNKTDLQNPNGSGTLYRKFTTKNGGETIALIVPNCYGWDKGYVNGNTTTFAWYQDFADGNNFAYGSGRLQTTTAAKKEDAKFSTHTGSEEVHCWELHFCIFNARSSVYSRTNGYANLQLTSSGLASVLGIHSHHGRETAVPIRPILKLEPDLQEYIK